MSEISTDRIQQFLRDYSWVIVRNVIGWLLIVAALPVGLVVPGPGGLPIFIIGFALVTFPGKRKLTARVLRGRRLRLEDRAYAFTAAFLAIAIPGLAWWAVWARYEHRIRQLIEEYTPKKSVFVLTALIAVLVTWLVTRLSLKLLNGLLRLLPRFRRKFRPWLQKKGLKLLPPRRRKAPREAPAEDEILEFDAKQRKRYRALWKRAQPWVKRLLAVGVTVWIVAIMIRPLRNNWPAVKEHVAALELWRFMLASGMFAVFLLCFRAFSWRRALKGFGYKLPYPAAARIWSVSELARYLPGAIWQVIGRVYLCKPYGIPGEIVSTSQILEVCVFLFANVLIASACLLWFGQKMMMMNHSPARPWLITALALVPTLGLLLHPKIFYTAANAILRKVGKPEIVKRLRGKKLIALLAWMMLGLVWQSVAVYLIVDPVLHFKSAWWWVVAGAYCLAWIAGFLAFWAPGGIGVRELVFVATMQAILPHQIREKFANPAALSGLLVLLGFLLRLWTVVGELMLTAAAYVWDYRRKINHVHLPVPAPSRAGGSAVDSGAATPSRSTSTAACQPTTQTRTATG